MSPALETVNSLELAKLVLRYRRPIGGAIPTKGKHMAFLAQRVLEDAGVSYWVAAAAEGAETSITCVQCGLTSHNPDDIANRYCVACHKFHQP